MGGSEAGAHSRGRVFLSSYLWKHSCRHIFSGELSGEDSTAHQPTAFIFSGWEIVNQDIFHTIRKFGMLVCYWLRFFMA